MVEEVKYISGPYISGPYAVDPDVRSGMEWNNHITVAADPKQRIAFMAHSDNYTPEQWRATAMLLSASWEMFSALTLARDAIRALRKATLLKNTENVSIRRILKEINDAIASAGAPT